MLNKKVIIIGLCKASDSERCIMSFTGHFKGVLIKKIILTGDACKAMYKGREYMLDAVISKVDGDTLYGSIERFVSIDSLFIDPT